MQVYDELHLHEVCVHQSCLSHSMVNGEVPTHIIH